MENKNVFVLMTAVIMCIIFIAVFGALLFHVATYKVEVYKEKTIDNEKVLIISEEYLGKADTNTFLLILVELVLAVSIFYVGVLNYMKGMKN